MLKRVDGVQGVFLHDWRVFANDKDEMGELEEDLSELQL